MSAGLVLAAAAANAQMLAPTDAGRSPYAGGFRRRRSLCGDAAGSAGAALRADACCRRGRSTRSSARTGFRRSEFRSQRGFVYTIAVIDRGGDDGRLVIDARNGRIIRFMPAYRMGDNYGEDYRPPYGPAVRALWAPVQGAMVQKVATARKAAMALRALWRARFRAHGSIAPGQAGRCRQRPVSEAAQGRCLDPRVASRTVPVPAANRPTVGQARLCSQARLAASPTRRR